MNNKIQKKQNYIPTKPGAQVLATLKEFWKDGVVKRHGYVRNPTTGAIEMGLKEIPVLGNAYHNKGVEKSKFYQFGSLVKKDDVERLDKIIQNRTFEVEKAISCFLTAPIIAADKKINPRSFEECEKLEAPLVSTLVKYKGEDKTQNLVFVLLARFVKAFGSKNDLNETDLGELSEYLVTNYRTISIAEIKMIFANTIATNRKVWRITFNDVVGLFEDFKNEKERHYANINYNKHLGIKSDILEEPEFKGIDASSKKEELKRQSDLLLKRN